MDERPPRPNIPRRAHSSFQPVLPPPPPRPTASSPIGFALGCALAGVWILLFTHWYLTGILAWIFVWIGFGLLTLGLWLAGFCLNDFIVPRQQP